MAKEQKKPAQKTGQKNIQPLADRVLIKPLETRGETRTASGIILPGKENNDKHERGTIIAVGGGRINGDGKRVSMDVKKGDVVWYKRGYDGEEVEVNGEELVLTSEGNILAVEK